MTHPTCSPRPAHTEGPWRISDNPYGAIVSDHPTGRVGEDGYTTADGLHFPGDRQAYGGYVICESVLACNKPLIAAAPEMFETLRFAEAWIAGRPPKSAVNVDDALGRLRSLIERIEEAERELEAEGAEAR